MAKRVMLVMEGCPHCKDAVESHKEEIEKGELKVVDVAHDEDAYRFVLAMKMPYVPNLLEVEKDGDRVKICQLDPRTGKQKQCKVVDL